MSAKKRPFLSTVTIHSSSITRTRLNRLMDEYPIFSLLRRWLEVQPNTIREGAQPVKILRELVEQCGKLVDAPTQAEKNEAISAITALLN